MPKDLRNEVNEEKRKKADISQVPEYLQDLYQRTCENINSPEHTHRFIELLNKNRDTFAMNKADL